MKNLELVLKDLWTTLQAEAADAGKELADAPQEVLQYMAEASMRLSKSVGLPGFEEAVAEERDNVAAKAALVAVAQADAADARVLAGVRMTIAVIARMLAAAEKHG